MLPNSQGWACKEACIEMINRKIFRFASVPLTRVQGKRSSHSQPPTALALWRLYILKYLRNFIRTKDECNSNSIGGPIFKPIWLWSIPASHVCQLHHAWDWSAVGLQGPMWRRNAWYQQGKSVAGFSLIVTVASTLSPIENTAVWLRQHAWDWSAVRLQGPMWRRNAWY